MAEVVKKIVSTNIEDTLRKYNFTERQFVHQLKLSESFFVFLNAKTGEITAQNAIGKPDIEYVDIVKLYYILNDENILVCAGEVENEVEN